MYTQTEAHGVKMSISYDAELAVDEPLMLAMLCPADGLWDFVDDAPELPRIP